MSKSFLLTAACLLLVLLVSCDESFNPSAAFQPRMVVYSILTTESDTQYVRVYSSYNSPDYDPTKNPEEISVKDAQVNVTENGGSTMGFQPFTIDRSDTSHYKSAITAYRAYPFRPEREKTYTLTVSSASLGTATATTTVPGRGSILVVNEFVLSSPLSTRSDFGVQATLSPEAKGFLVRIYVDYLYSLDNTNYRMKRFEIPLARRVISCFWGLFEESYPHPKRRSTPTNAPWGSNYTQYGGPVEALPYSTLAYLAKLSYIYDREGEGIRFQHAVVYLVQFDVPLWNYYGVANMFQDPFSVRLDEASYTNIKNGTGVFGSMAVDSLVRPLPQVIPHMDPGCY